MSKFQSDYIIDAGSLMICLGENITLAIVDEIAKLYKEYNSKLWQAVFRDFDGGQGVVNKLNLDAEELLKNIRGV